jgi:transcriptional regulator with XRE-family HTH domain
VGSEKYSLCILVKRGSFVTELTRHIGQRIRLYRKSNGLTLEELAARIHKSKSSVSKYESGDIAVDVETLVEIANALGIDLWQLLDVDQVHNRPAFPDRVPTGFFAKVNRFYMYYLNKNSTRVVRSVLEINYGGSHGYSSILYADVKDYENLFLCRHLYYGDIQYSDSYVNLVMQNQNNLAERTFLNIANPFGQSTVTTGMISGTSAKYMVPISLKIILSQNKLSVDKSLQDALRFTKEDLRRMRQTYCFSVERHYESEENE